MIEEEQWFEEMFQYLSKFLFFDVSFISYESLKIFTMG